MDTYMMTLLRYAKKLPHPSIPAVVVVITPPLPRDEGKARTAIQVHTVNLIDIRLGERWQPILNQP